MSTEASNTRTALLSVRLAAVAAIAGVMIAGVDYLEWANVHINSLGIHHNTHVDIGVERQTFTFMETAGRWPGHLAWAFSAALACGLLLWEHLAYVRSRTRREPLRVRGAVIRFVVLAVSGLAALAMSVDLVEVLDHKHARVGQKVVWLAIGTLAVAFLLECFAVRKRHLGFGRGEPSPEAVAVGQRASEPGNSAGPDAAEWP